MKLVGLTGGIGSGKTLVAQLFETFGIPVFYADEEAKKLYDANDRLRTQLMALLGSDIYEGGQLQRKVMAVRIFSDVSLLEKVNHLVHPLLDECFKAYSARQHAPYVMMEAAILFESGLNKRMQHCITVSASENLRIQRVMQRDGVSEETIRQRIQYQWTDKQRIALSGFVIVNDGEQALLPQVVAIHEKLMATT